MATGSVIVDPLAVIKKLRALCADEESQPLIVRRNTTPVILNFLREENPLIAQLAAECLRELSSHPDNKQLLASEEATVNALWATFQNASVEMTTREVAADALLNLNGFYPQSANIDIGDLLAFRKRPAVSASSAKPIATPTTPSTPAQAPLLTKSRNVHFSVPKLTSESARRQLEDALLNTRGVISYSLDITAKKASVFCQTPTIRLEAVFAQTGFPATLTEEEAPMTDGPSSFPTSPEPNTAKYVSPKKEKENAAYKNSLTVVTSNSLDARLERKKGAAASDDKGKKVKSFLGKVASVFW